jgi:DNA polymerase-1
MAKQPDPVNGAHFAKTLYLVDGSAYVFRAYHAVRGLSNSKGLPTNATFGFTRMLLKLMEDRQPQYLALFFDAKGPTFRHEIFHQYKANRPPMPEDLAVQLPYIKKVTAGFQVPMVEIPGYEADDLIGTYARLAEQAGFQVVMVTGDKDFMQLVTDHVTIWDPMKDKVLDMRSITADFALKPHQIIDVMGLSGDSIDNVPGVPGIGPKTALSLIQTFGSLEKVYEQIESVAKPKLRENLLQHKDQAFLSRRLVTIDTSAPVPFDLDHFQAKPPDLQQLSDLFGELEFRQLQQQFPAKADLSQKRYRAIFSQADLEALIHQLKKAKIFALDTETTAIDPMQARLVGLSFAIRPHEAFYIPVGHNYPGAPTQLDLSLVLTNLQPILEDPTMAKVGQNIKYDWIVLARHGVALNGVVFDTMLASYLIDPSKRAHNLDVIARDFLNHVTITYEEVAGKGKNSVGFDQVPMEKAVPYACEDADITLLARDQLLARLCDGGLMELMEKVEMPLVPVLVKMEMTGICVDRKLLMDLSKQFEHQLEQIESEIYSVAGERFNINSSQQLGAILFEKLNLPVQKKTRKKTCYSTDVDVLTTLAAQHAMPALILRHRSLAKLKSTYTDALLDLINPDTSRIHTSFNQTVAATGRLSSSDPNLQNIPIRTEEGREIRKAFVPRVGWSIVSADYSQIELRILAHCADDQILIKAFRQDEDIHLRTAAEVFQIFPEMITPELRRQAKVINFGIIYGMGAFRLANELGISQKMAKTYIDHYFEGYKGVKAFIDETIRTARKTGQTSTLLGRIRLLPDINSPNHTIRQFAERTAVNTPIQGTAADLIKLAMIRLDAAITAKGLQSAMLLSVHDEIVFEVPPEELSMMKDLIQKQMEGVWDLKVPLKVNVGAGRNWAEAH